MDEWLLLPLFWYKLPILYMVQLQVEFWTIHYFFGLCYWFSIPTIKLLKSWHEHIKSKETWVRDIYLIKFVNAFLVKSIWEFILSLVFIKVKEKKVVGSVFLSYLKCKLKGIITLISIENLIFLIYFFYAFYEIN